MLKTTQENRTNPLLVLIAALATFGCAATEDRSVSSVAEGPNPRSAEPVAPAAQNSGRGESYDLPSEVSNETDERKTERHPTPLVDQAVKTKTVEFSCPPLESEQAVPRGLFNPGSELIHIPEGARPPWQSIFGKDYIAVQGLALLQEESLLGVCSGTDEFIAVRIQENGTGIRSFTLRPSTYLRELEPNQGIAYSVLQSPFNKRAAPNRYGRCESILSTPDTLYFSHREDQFRPRGYVIAYDVTGPIPKRKAFRTQLGESYGGMAVTDQGLAVAAFGDGVLFLDEQLQVRRKLEEVNQAGDIVSLPGHVAVANGKNGVVIISTRSNQPPKVVGRVPLPGFAKQITTGPRGTVLVALGSAGFAQLDTSNPRKPVVLSLVNTPGSALDIASHENGIAVADWTSVRLYKSDEKGKVTLVDVQQTNASMGRSLNVTMDAKRIFVGDWKGVHSFDYDINRESPVLAFEQRTLALGLSPTGKTDTKASVRLTNEGEHEATLFAMGTAGEGFEHVGPSPPVLGPGESADFIFRLSNELEAETRGLFTVCGPTGPVSLKLKANAQHFGKGKDAPNVALELIDEKTRWELKEHRGKPVLMVYFATF